MPDDCIVVCPPCHREAIDGKRICSLHDWYFRVFLADPYWRNHEPPEPEAPQLTLRLGESL